MAEVPVIVTPTALLNEVIQQAQVRQRDARQGDARVDVVRGEAQERIRDANNQAILRQEDIDFRRELDLQRQRELDARIRAFEDEDARIQDRQNLPRGSIIDIEA